MVRVKEERTWNARRKEVREAKQLQQMAHAYGLQVGDGNKIEQRVSGWGLIYTKTGNPGNGFSSDWTTSASVLSDGEIHKSFRYTGLEEGLRSECG